MNTSLAKSSTTVDRYCAAFADILSQAVTGELVGMQNFASMVELYDDVEEKIEAVEHTENEKCHAVTFESVVEELGVSIIVNLEAPYWKQIRSAFLHWAKQKDLTACILIQEVMLESFAVSMYSAASDVAKGKKLSRVLNPSLLKKQNILSMLQSCSVKNMIMFPMVLKKKRAVSTKMSCQF